MTTVGEQHERKALAFIVDSVERRGYPPSTRELADVLGHASTSSTHRVLHQLISKGLLSAHVHESGHRLPRAVAITDAGREMIARTEPM